MDKHPIENIMNSTLEDIRDMVDVNTVIGDAILTQDGSTVIPISKVSFGFVAGGGEYSCGGRGASDRLPFAGGTGAGVSIQPMGFLVSGDGGVRLLPAQPYAPTDRIIEMAPQLMNEIRKFLAAKNESRRSIPLRGGDTAQS